MSRSLAYVLTQEGLIQSSRFGDPALFAENDCGACLRSGGTSTTEKKATRRRRPVPHGDGRGLREMSPGTTPKARLAHEVVATRNQVRRTLQAALRGLSFISKYPSRLVGRLGAKSYTSLPLLG